MIPRYYYLCFIHIKCIFFILFFGFTFIFIFSSHPFPPWNNEITSIIFQCVIRRHLSKILRIRYYKILTTNNHAVLNLFLFLLFFFFFVLGHSSSSYQEHAFLHNEHIFFFHLVAVSLKHIY